MRKAFSVGPVSGAQFNAGVLLPIFAGPVILVGVFADPGLAQATDTCQLTVRDGTGQVLFEFQAVGVGASGTGFSESVGAGLTYDTGGGAFVPTNPGMSQLPPRFAINPDWRVTFHGNQLTAQDSITLVFEPLED